MNKEKERNKVILRQGVHPKLADFFLVEYDEELYISNYRRKLVELSREKFGNKITPVFLDIWEEEWITGDSNQIIFYMGNNRLVKVELTEGTIVD